MTRLEELRAALKSALNKLPLSEECDATRAILERAADMMAEEAEKQLIEQGHAPRFNPFIGVIAGAQTADGTVIIQGDFGDKDRIQPVDMSLISDKMIQGHWIETPLETSATFEPVFKTPVISEYYEYEPATNWVIEFLAQDFILTKSDPKVISYTIEGVSMSTRIPKQQPCGEQIEWAGNRNAETVTLEIERTDGTTYKRKFKTTDLLDFKQAKLNSNQNE